MKTSTAIKAIIFIIVAGALLYGAKMYNASLDKAAADRAVAEKDKVVAAQQSKMDKLKITDVRIGTGPEAKVNDQITVNYEGTLENGTKFDSSYDRGEPITFGLTPGGLIEGWILGIPGMKVGGKRTLTIPPDLAYGDRGAGASVPPGATLNFTVELLAVNGQK